MQHPLSCSSLVQIKSSTLAVRIHSLTLLLSAVLSLHPYSLSLNTFYFSLSLRSSRPLHNLFLLFPPLIPSQPLSLSHPLSTSVPLSSHLNLCPSLIPSHHFSLSPPFLSLFSLSPSLSPLRSPKYSCSSLLLRPVWCTD
jgi:hypothetical protein